MRNPKKEDRASIARIIAQGFRVSELLLYNFVVVELYVHEVSADTGVASV